MCFNKEVSLLLFIFGFIVSIKLINQNDTSKKISGIGLLLLSSMQLLEFFIWYFIKNNFLNNFFSYLIPFTIIIHVIGMYFSGFFLGDLNESESIVSFIFTLIFLFTCLFINKSQKTTINSACKLKWNILNLNSIILSFLFVISYIIVICLNFYHGYKGLESMILILITFLFSYFFNWMFKEQPSLANNGSLWCFLCLFLTTFYYLLL